MTTSQQNSATSADDRIQAVDAAKLHRLPLSSFNTSRRELQLVQDRASGRLLPYPDLTRDALGNQLSDAERRRREVEFDAKHILVVPEWGGIRYPRSSWTYSRRRCEAILGGDVASLERVPRRPTE